jgi:hypothetical protein
MKKTYTIAFLLTVSIFVPSTSFAATAKTTPPVVQTQQEVEKRVREYFKDIPVMIEIARCESNFRQFTDAGNVLRGGDGGGMVGVYQFFESIHAAGAKALGFDIATLEGNLAYARHVYNSEGVTPWEPVRSCFEKTTTATATLLVTKDTAALRAQIKQLTELITLLQKQLKLKQAEKQKK